VRAARATGVPLVLEVNSPLVQEMAATRRIYFRGLAERVERSIFQGADRIAVVTQALGEILVGLGAPRERLFVTPNGIDPHRYARRAYPAVWRSRWGIPEGAVVLGFVGFYRPWHRLDRVVRCLPELPNAFCVSVGDGPARAETEALARDLGVEKRVLFPGRVTGEEIPGVVAAFDVALIPAINVYASPLKLFDYLAAGRATIAPDQPNLREVVQHGRTGWLFDPGSDASFHEGVLRLVRDLRLRQEIAEAGQRLIAEYPYTWDANVTRILAQVAALRPSGAPPREPAPLRG